MQDRRDRFPNTLRSRPLSYGFQIRDVILVSHMSGKADVWQGTLALMILKTL